MYWYTIVGAGGFGLAMVVMPKKDFADTPTICQIDLPSKPAKTIPDWRFEMHL